jgi:hypothetical protein
MQLSLALQALRAICVALRQTRRAICDDLVAQVRRASPPSGCRSTHSCLLASFTRSHSCISTTCTPAPTCSWTRPSKALHSARMAPTFRAPGQGRCREPSRRVPRARSVRLPPRPRRRSLRTHGMRAHTCMRTRTHACARMHCAHAYAQCACAHMHARVRTHLCMHTHVCTHTQA